MALLDDAEPLVDLAGRPADRVQLAEPAGDEGLSRFSSAFGARLFRAATLRGPVGISETC